MSSMLFISFSRSSPARPADLPEVAENDDRFELTLLDAGKLARYGDSRPELEADTVVGYAPPAEKV